MSTPNKDTRPARRFDPELLLKAQDVRVAFFDVDGVLTDGGLYISKDGEQHKRFNTLDGHGIKLLIRAGITPVVITGRDSAALRSRLRALGISEAYFGTEDKAPVAQQTLTKLGAQWNEAAAIGDDWPDLPVLQQVGFACAPPGAHEEVLARVHHVTQARGGEGAAREFCDLLLQARAAYADLLADYLR